MVPALTADAATSERPRPGMSLRRSLLPDERSAASEASSRDFILIFVLATSAVHRGVYTVVTEPREGLSIEMKRPRPTRTPHNNRRVLSALAQLRRAHARQPSCIQPDLSERPDELRLLTDQPQHLARRRRGARRDRLRMLRRGVARTSAWCAALLNQ